MSERHARQIVLPEVGAEGQARLARAHVLVVGAGGLGSPAIMYLAGAGVGSLTVVDPDVVEASNLHRQPIHAGRVGGGKAESAAAFVAALDPAVEVTPLAERLTPANAAALVAEAQLVLDCADNFAVSYTLSDACMGAGVPLISASALALGGYVGGFCGQAPSLRAVVPALPAPARARAPRAMGPTPAATAASSASADSGMPAARASTSETPAAMMTARTVSRKWGRGVESSVAGQIWARQGGMESPCRGGMPVMR
ncbi:HesA/MoeB/ThiF family protein, partial [Paracoccus sphaerophysae]|uniref:HesA/MoeB/ThiF family protein n=1 Tax=Paracoccus sphaerophysae TaxID=690417 RepID=UPI0018DD14B0